MAGVPRGAKPNINAPTPKPRPETPTSAPRPGETAPAKPPVVEETTPTNLPSSRSPDVDTPNGRTPDVDTPNTRPKTPDVDTPNVRTPEIDTPNARTPNVDTPNPARVEPEAPAPRNADGTADVSNATPESVSARESSVSDSGRVESDQLSDRQIKNELDHIKDNPNLVEGTPPNRKARIGEHEWHEQPGGGWCRHSDGEVCVPPNNKDLQDLREKYNLPDQPTIGVGKTDIPGLENETFEGMSPALRKEAGLESLDETMPNREIKSPYSSPQFTRHAEEDILNQVHERIKELKLSESALEGKTLFLHIDNGRGVCNKCAVGLLNPDSAKIGVVKQFSNLHPTVKIKITAQDADALIRSERKGGSITTLVVQDGKVIEISGE